MLLLNSIGSPRERLRRYHALVALGIVALSARNAPAFCPARTCNRATQNCAEDQNGCLASGTPIAWHRKDVTISIDPMGSQRLGITAEQTRASLERAFQSWQQVTCPNGETPSLSLAVAEASNGATPETVGALSYVDANWRYAENYGALTQLTLDLDSGEILGAMLEINSEKHALAVDASPPAIDLDAILTHEVGHLIGLDHTSVLGATMVAETVAFGSQELRSLEADDISGVCALYPPRVTEPTDDGDASNSTSACAMPRKASGRSTLWLFALGAVALMQLRRARARVSRALEDDPVT